MSFLMHFDMLELKPQQLYQYILSSFPSMAAGRAGQHRAGGPMSPWTQILQKRYKLALSCAQKLSLTTITTLRGASGPCPDPDSLHFWMQGFCPFAIHFCKVYFVRRMPMPKVPESRHAPAHDSTAAAMHSALSLEVSCQQQQLW